MCDLEFVKLLGEGTFSQVILVRKDSDGNEYAYKSFKTENAIVRSLTEIDILFRSRTSVLMTGREFFSSGTCVIDGKYGRVGGIVVDARRGDMDEFVKVMEQNEIYDGDVDVLHTYLVLADILHQVLSSIECLHCMGYLHGDIKPANILFDNAQTFYGGLPRFNYYLSDFGGATPVLNPTDKVGFPRSFTPMYTAPEVYIQQQFTQKSDIFSLGISVLELMGHRPTPPSVAGINYGAFIDYFRINFNQAVIEQQFEPTTIFLDNLISRYPAAAKWKPYIDNIGNVIKAMCEFDPERRPSAHEALMRLSSVPTVYHSADFRYIRCQSLDSFTISVPQNLESVCISIGQFLEDPSIRTYPLKIITLTISLFLRKVCSGVTHHELGETLRNCLSLSSVFYTNNISNEAGVLDILMSQEIQGKIFIDPFIRGNSLVEIRERLLLLTSPFDFDKILRYVNSFSQDCGGVIPRVIDMPFGEIWFS